MMERMNTPFEVLSPTLAWIPGEEGWPALFSSHTYIVIGERLTAVIDPGCLTHRIALQQTFKALKITPDLIVATHEHWDHMTAADFFPHAQKAASKATCDAINIEDPERVRHMERGITYRCRYTRILEDGEIIDLGNVRLEVLITPGHTAGSLCLYEPQSKALFTGDSFFKPPMLSGIFGDGSRAEHVRSLERLFRLTEKRGVNIIYPGHGERIEGRADCLDSLEEILERAREDV